MKYHLYFLSVQCLTLMRRSISQTPTMQDGQLAIPAIDGVHHLLGRDTRISHQCKYRCNSLRRYSSMLHPLDTSILQPFLGSDVQS